jgi:lysophospholipase L1-like esterase
VAGACAVCAAIAWKAHVLYRDQQVLRLDPLELSGVPPAQLRPAQGRPVLVILGDSRAAQWPARPAFAAYDVRNLGVGGQTSAQVAARYALQVAPLRPQVLLVQVGVNDLKAIALLPHRRDAIVARCIEHIDDIVARARRDGSHVVLTTVFPVGRASPLRALYWRREATDALVTVNRHIRAQAGPNLTVLDAAEVLADPDGVVRDEFSADFLHLAPAGYAALDKLLASALDSQAQASPR